jgi:hypothetical protein
MGVVFATVIMQLLMYNVNVLDFNTMKKGNMFRLNTDLRIMQNISPH